MLVGSIRVSSDNDVRCAAARRPAVPATRRWKHVTTSCTTDQPSRRGGHAGPPLAPPPEPRAMAVSRHHTGGVCAGMPQRTHGAWCPPAPADRRGQVRSESWVERRAGALARPRRSGSVCGPYVLGTVASLIACYGTPLHPCAPTTPSDETDVQQATPGPWVLAQGEDE